jgi:hypothetical protein
VLALFKAQASMVAKEFGTRVVIYRFARAEIEYDTDKPRG